MEDVAAWLEARLLRNRLVHEYMTDVLSFAEDLNLADSYSRILLQTYRRISEDAARRLHLSPEKLPGD